MAEHFSFFDPVQLPDGTYDREYNAEKFTKYFGVLVTTGVMKGEGNMLAVSVSGSNMVTKINTGVAFVEAKYYENDSFKELTHDTESLGNSRIDRIVIRMDLSTEARYVRVFIKKGVPSTNPVPPTLTQTPNLYEISLAQVKVVGGQTFISVDAVMDERGKDVICPWAGSKILPNFDEGELEKVIAKVDNSWQKGVYNSTTVTNLGPYSAARTLLINQSDWKNTGNVEQLNIDIPVGGAFSGIIKVSFASFWGDADGSGGAEVIYEVASYPKVATTTNKVTILQISERFSQVFNIRQAQFNVDNGNIVIPILRSPTGNTPMVIKVEMHGYTSGGKSIFDTMRSVWTASHDLGSPTVIYPWVPQKSSIDRAAINNIVDGRAVPSSTGNINVALLNPQDFRDFLAAIVSDGMGTFKCLVNTPDIGASSLTNEGYGILTTTKPWRDESGGGLNQIFEAADVILKRYQINGTTWSPWVVTQHKDVDIKQLFQSVSEGKASNRNALAQKGVSVPVNPTFAEISNGILAVQTFRFREQSYAMGINTNSRELDFVFDAGFPIRHATINVTSFTSNNTTMRSGATTMLTAGQSGYMKTGGSISNGSVIQDVYPYRTSNSLGSTISGNQVLVRLTFISAPPLDTQTVPVTICAWG